MKFLIAFLTFVTLSPLASAGLISIGNPSDGEFSKLFATEVKVDMPLMGGRGHGHDVFLRQGEMFSGDSTGFDWKDLDSDLKSYDQTIDWTLTKDDSDLMFVFGDHWLTNTSLIGDWNGLGIWFSFPGRSGMFSSSNVTVDIGGQTFTSDDPSKRELITLVQDDFSTLTSISGSARFQWTLDEDYSGNYNPNGLMAVSFKGLELNSDPTDVLEPKTSILFLMGLILLGFTRRQVNRTS